MLGRVKFFNGDKGFGFIIGKDNEDYFYHSSQVKDFRLVEMGDLVEFEPSENNKGKNAIKIKVMKKAPKQSPKQVSKQVQKIVNHVKITHVEITHAADFPSSYDRPKQTQTEKAILKWSRS